LYIDGQAVFLLNEKLGQHRTIPAWRLKHRSGGCARHLRCQNAR